MKRLVTFFLMCIITVYSATICYAGNSALTGEQGQTDFGIYATYIAGKTVHGICTLLIGWLLLFIQTFQ